MYRETVNSDVGLNNHHRISINIKHYSPYIIFIAWLHNRLMMKNSIPRNRFYPLSNYCRFQEITLTVIRDDLLQLFACQFVKTAKIIRSFL